MARFVICFARVPPHKSLRTRPSARVPPHKSLRTRPSCAIIPGALPLFRPRSPLACSTYQTRPPGICSSLSPAAMSGVTLPPSKAKSLRESEALARKRMRKGTRSCLQCRSRKVRCTYPANSRICHGCLTHGRDCTEQTYNEVKNGGLDKRVGLKERVRELEALVEQLVEKGGADAREIEQRLRKSKDSDAASSGGFLSPPDSNADKDGR